MTNLQKTFHRVFSAFVAIILSSMAVASIASAEVHFQSISFEQAEQTASSEHKIVMVDFYTSWCGWCKVLDKNTYTDPTVTKLTDAQFVCVKIDAEKGEGIELAKKYQVTGYPTIIFFDGTGKLIDRVVGYEPPDRFARSLEVASEGGSEAIINKVENSPSTANARQWLIAANYYAQHKDAVKSLAAFKKVLALDPQNKFGNNAEALYGAGFLSSGNEQEQILDSALRVFPNEMDADQATMLLIHHDFEVKNPDVATRRINDWAVKHPKDGAMFNYFAWTAAQYSMALTSAEEYVQRAIQLAPSTEEKASAIDTHAEILFKQGKASEASKVEAGAIAMLDPVKDKKLVTELDGQKAKFDQGVAGTATMKN